MIRILVVRENGYIKKVTLRGHANYDEYGKDIVCAAVSATYLCTVNGILMIQSDAIEVTSNDGIQVIEVVQFNELIEKLLYNMIVCLESLEQKYPKYIQIR